jgi:hypothetical protein
MTRENFNRLVKYGGFGLVALLISPLVFLILKGIMGMAAIAVALAVAAVANALIPAFSEWLTQLKFRSLKAVISRAPIETMIQRAKERWEAITEQRALLQDQLATLQGYKRKTEETAQRYPEEAESMRLNLSQYEQLFAYRVDAFKEAKLSAEKYDHMVEKAEAMFSLAQADAKMSQSFGKQEDFMVRFKEKYAFDAVNEASDKAIANLRMALVDNNYAEKIEAPAHAITYDRLGNVVLGTTLEIKATVAR